MTVNDIKHAIDSGYRVFWFNVGYEVIRDSIGQYLIIWDRGGLDENCIGLTWRDGVTLNGKAEEFFTCR